VLACINIVNFYSLWESVNKFRPLEELDLVQVCLSFRRVITDCFAISTVEVAKTTLTLVVQPPGVDLTVFSKCD